MQHLLSIALGTFVNRVRGGLFNKWISGLGISALTSGKVLNDVAFALWFTIISGMTYNGVVDGAPDYSITFNVLAALIMFGAMFLGRAPGWGEYVGGMVEQRVTGKKEIEHIDELVLSDINYPVLRNAAALSLRGAMWTVSLAAGFLLCKFIAYPHIAGYSLIWLALSGLLMGAVYFVAIEIAERFTGKDRDYGWALGEYIWGGLLWLSCSLAVAS